MIDVIMKFACVWCVLGLVTLWMQRFIRPAKRIPWPVALFGGAFMCGWSLFDVVVYHRQKAPNASRDIKPSAMDYHVGLTPRRTAAYREEQRKYINVANNPEYQPRPADLRAMTEDEIQAWQLSQFEHYKPMQWSE